MPGDQCIVCSNTRHKDKNASLHRLPRKKPKRGRWLDALGQVEEDVKNFHRVCSRHFLDGDAMKDPQINLGKRFASPKKRWTLRAKRGQKRTRLFNQGPESSSSRSVTPGSGSNWILVSKLMSYPVMAAFLYLVHLLLQ